MNFYNEEKILKWKNILTVLSLALLSVFLFFKVYVYFEKSIQIITGTIFPFILSFVIVYSLMPFIDMLSETFKMNRKMAILLVLLIFLIFFIYVILAFIPLIAGQLSSLIEFFIKNQERLQRNMFSFLEQNNINIRDSIINSKEVIFTNFIKILNSSVSVRMFVIIGFGRKSKSDESDYGRGSIGKIVETVCGYGETAGYKSYENLHRS